MNKIILLTGANGFLGTQITSRLLKQYNHKIIVLMRGESKEDAVNRLYRGWWEFPELLEEIGGRIPVLNGDISKSNLGLKKDEYEKLVQNITHIIHTAADWRLKSSHKELQKTNVQGTQNLLELAQLAHEDHGLERFSHLSTAYVAGAKMGIISENNLTSKHGFLNNYEKTKFESEIEVKKSEFNISIFRPSMIVGDSTTGYVKTFNTIYIPLKLYLKGQLPIIPAHPSMKVNLVPVDYVADAVIDLTFDSRAANKTFHLTAPRGSLPTLKELLKFVKKWSHENLNVKLNNPIYMPLNITFIQKISSIGKIFEKTARLFETINTLSPYLNENRDYQRNNTDKILGPYKHDWHDFLPKILEFAIYYGFLHRSNRTVHEQVLFRLKSRSMPTHYHDIVKGEIKNFSALDIHQNIIKALKSLQKMGIQKGDKIAITGFNSTRYFILDIAIGLTGAVSVPIYYTSPLDEIKQILSDSCAKIFFVGNPKLLKDLKDMRIPIISFHNGKDDIISWKKFLKIGEKRNKIANIPLNFNDVATIRYTSGTTGKPRGVIFTHGNLRWMAEFIASMPPWKDRTNEVSYLSFLPMNHVVEGIFGTYSPYYAPTSLNIYFLENFQNLVKALRITRPTIFFSVPRFYEKVWDSLRNSKIGKTYLNSKGILKKLLKKLIKKRILKKTGLDKCKQLIVGSAPINDDILQSYHEIDIEVHNAYGLTEAPLVTINKTGRNRIGTVGEPLPSTDISIASDGEILVKGPQVTQGYFKGNSIQIFKNGWLHTGDIGHITPQGSLVITGRKKEFIINSYGKTINPLKIEGMLKNIPGIREAMIIGDEKPYCSALLWTKEAHPKSIDDNIKEINTCLSHPEKIKRWVVLNDDLSIGADLTPNLKLKRKAIIKRYRDVVEFIYGDGPKTCNILHFGHVKVLS